MSLFRVGVSVFSGYLFVGTSRFALLYFIKRCCVKYPLRLGRFSFEHPCPLFSLELRYGNVRLSLNCISALSVI